MNKILKYLKPTSVKSRIIAAIIAAILALLGIQSCSILTRNTLPETTSFPCGEHDSCTVFHIITHVKNPS